MFPFFCSTPRRALAQPSTQPTPPRGRASAYSHRDTREPPGAKVSELPSDSPKRMRRLVASAVEGARRPATRVCSVPPPRFGAHDVKTLANSAALLALAGAAFTIAFDPHPVALLTCATCTAAALGARITSQRNTPRAAALLTFGSWAAVMGGTALGGFNGGVYDAMVLVVVMAALVYGARGAWRAALAASVGALLIDVWHRSRGGPPWPDSIPPAQAWVVGPPLFLGAAWLAGRSDDALRAALEETRRALTHAAKSAARLRLAMRATHDGIWEWDLVRDELIVSARWCEIIGIPCDGDECRMEPAAWLERIHPDDVERVRMAVRHAIEEPGKRVDVRYRMRGEAHAWIWVHSRGMAEVGGDGTPIRLAGSHADVTAEEEARHRLQVCALTDPMTALPNRAAALRRLADVLHAVRTSPDSSCGLILIDLTEFRSVNDSLGHTAGDQVLMAVAARITRTLRAGDAVARVGGDEFLVFVRAIATDSELRHVAERLRVELLKPYEFGDERFQVEVCMGLKRVDASDPSPEDVLRDIYLALADARLPGRRNRVAAFHVAMRRQAERRRELQTRLQEALENDELHVVYQPIVDVRTGVITAVEALVRWNDEVEGPISPVEFIPLAEESGLVIDLDRWVLRQAARKVRELQRRIPGAEALCLSVNLSSQQFARDDLADAVRSTLAEVDLDPIYLWAEITEQTLLVDTDVVRSNLARLREMGVRIEIDDFGTGYSAFGYLHRLPVGGLKVDRSFVRRLTADGRDLAIVRAIVSVAHELGLAVVAEGVETWEQFSRLAELGCEYVQGFLLARPLEPADLERVVRAGPGFLMLAASAGSTPPSFVTTSCRLDSAPAEA